MTAAEKLRKLFKSGTDSQLVDYVGDNRILFKLLIDTYIAGPYRTTQRLSAALTRIASEKPILLRPHFKSLIAAVDAADASTALKRNTIRMFQFVPVPRRYHGQIIDICFRFLQDRKEAIAVRVFSMTVLENLTRGQQELRRELQIMVEDEFPYGTPAFRSRGAKILKKLSSPILRHP